MEYFKLQIGCLAILFFIIFIYLRQVGVNKDYKNYSLFTAIYINAIVAVTLDGITAYTVNHLNSVNYLLNAILHFAFYISLDFIIYLTFLYIFSLTRELKYSTKKLILLSIPFLLNLIFLCFTIDKIQFITGTISNYSHGIPVYTCYAIVLLYLTLTFFTFIHKWKYIEKRKRLTIFVYTTVSLCTLIIQLIYPEILITSIVPVIFVLGIYLNHEEPAVKKLLQINQQTVIDFATLVENRDNNTGEHIKRTTAYVSLLLSELQEYTLFKDSLSKDFINNLKMAAPMHDIGKIGTPDAILQKPGKLTDEEYKIMKNHSTNGAAIIKNTFGKHGDENFIEIAYSVAMYHHEKWNGKGYPKGLKGKEIPLAARIMAIADVFDAISQKRCYRDAMPLDQCFDIIQKGKGQDFDPLLADIFIKIRPKVEQVFNEI